MVSCCSWNGEKRKKNWILFIEYKQVVGIPEECVSWNINHVTGSVLWEIFQNVDDELFRSYGLCYDVDGRVYVADSVNERVIVLNGKIGRFIQTLSAAGSGGMYDEYWRSKCK